MTLPLYSLWYIIPWLHQHATFMYSVHKAYHIIIPIILKADDTLLSK